MMKSKQLDREASSSLSELDTKRPAPNRRASASLDDEELTTVTSAPIDAASCTAMCPNPPNPRTPTRVPLPTPQRRRGEYVVIPAQSSGAARARGKSGEILSTYGSSTTIREE